MNAWEKYWNTKSEYKNKKKKIHSVVFSGNDVCAQCGTSENLTLDHVIPMRKGGTNEVNNFQILCMDCNRRKRSR